MGFDDRDYMRGPSRGPGALVQGWRAVEIIIAINLAIFLAWSFLAYPGAEKTSFLSEHFVVGWTQLTEGKVWTPVTSFFSHRELFHLLMNMFILWSFGRVVESEMGTRRFVTFYMVSGVVAGLVHSFLSVLGWPNVSALGASGAVCAVVIAFVVAHPKQTLLLFFVIPMPAYMLAVFFVGIDLFGLIQQFGGGAPWDNIGHGAHLGGAAYGFLYVMHARGRIRLPSLPGLPRSSGRTRRRRRRSSGDHEIPMRATVPPRKDRDEERMDELLKKVHEGGLDALTAEEREWMISQSKRYRD